jgi:hypothetical protein
MGLLVPASFARKPATSSAWSEGASKRRCRVTSPIVAIRLVAIFSYRQEAIWGLRALRLNLESHPAVFWQRAWERLNEPKLPFLEQARAVDTRFDRAIPPRNP